MLGGGTRAMTSADLGGASGDVGAARLLEHSGAEQSSSMVGSVVAAEVGVCSAGHP